MRQNPDPSKVKAGDTVTLEMTDPYVAKVEGVVHEVKEYARVDSPDALFFMVGGYMLSPLGGHNQYTLTDHQPAPEPEPEWKPGTVADVTPHRRPDLASRAVRGEDDMWHNTYGGMWDDDEVSVKPLVVIDRASNYVQGLVRLAHDKGASPEGQNDRTLILSILAGLGIEAP